MSECVVRMEMPENCEACPMCGTASGGNGMYELWCMCGDFSTRSRKRPDNCPIICALPENHGRLVDADAYDYPGDLKWEETIVPAERRANDEAD